MTRQPSLLATTLPPSPTPTARGSRSLAKVFSGGNASNLSNPPRTVGDLFRQYDLISPKDPNGAALSLVLPDNSPRGAPGPTIQTPQLLMLPQGISPKLTLGDVLARANIIFPSPRSTDSTGHPGSILGGKGGKGGGKGGKGGKKSGGVPADVPEGGGFTFVVPRHTDDHDHDHDQNGFDRGDRGGRRTTKRSRAGRGRDEDHDHDQDHDHGHRPSLKRRATATTTGGGGAGRGDGTTKKPSVRSAAQVGGAHGRAMTAEEEKAQMKAERARRNRESAARSRAARQQYTENLESRVKELETTNAEMRREIATLRLQLGVGGGASSTGASRARGGNRSASEPRGAAARGGRGRGCGGVVVSPFPGGKWPLPWRRRLRGRWCR